MFLEKNWFKTWGLFLDHNTIYQSRFISEICRYQISHHVVASIKDSFQEFDQTSNTNSSPQIYLTICLLLLASISFKLTKTVCGLEANMNVFIVHEANPFLYTFIFWVFYFN